MTTPLDRMLAGLPYDPADPVLAAMRLRARTLCQRLNQLPPADRAGRESTLAELFGRPVTAVVTPPFQCDYGVHIELGEQVYFNVDCVVLDVARVRIGAHTMFGPGVHLYTATHPLDAAQRRSGLESAQPIDIGQDVWVGGGSIVCPGVTIGERTVVGAGSVVTRSLPPGVLAAGNPCRVIRALQPGEPPG